MPAGTRSSPRPTTCASWALAEAAGRAGERGRYPAGVLRFTASCSSSWCGMPIGSCYAGASASSPSTSCAAWGAVRYRSCSWPRRRSWVPAHSACGLAAGAALSPAFGAVAAFALMFSWRLAFSFSPDSAAWAAGCFAVVFAVNAVDGARASYRAAPADRAHVRRARAGAHAPRRPGRAGRPGGARRGPARGRMGSCVFQPVYFIALIIPMGFAACFATSFVARLGVAAWGERARGSARAVLERSHRVHRAAGRARVQYLDGACVRMRARRVAVCMMVAGSSSAWAAHTRDALNRMPRRSRRSVTSASFTGRCSC